MQHRHLNTITTPVARSALLLLASLTAVYGSDAPRTVFPSDQAVTYAPHPHFRWSREDDIAIDDVHHVQIARNDAFTDVVCEDRLEVVSRFVPVSELPPGRYWWRVRRDDGNWSKAVGFHVRAPDKTFSIHAGCDADTVARVLLEAGAAGPARVDFEPGEYSLSPAAGKSLVTLNTSRDLIIDGHGAHLVLGGTFLDLKDCQRITVRNFTLTPSKAGHTLVRVVNKDPAEQQLTVIPEPGYPSDVASYFQFPGTAGSFLGCMDPIHQGKYVVGAVVSARNARCTPVRNPPGSFAFHPVASETLARVPLGAVAVVTAYGWHWLKTTRTDECTFSDLTLVGLPGALCAGAGNDSAKSFLKCKVKRLTEEGYFGGHSHTARGRIGEWIEGCEFECLADDGPAQQSFRRSITGIAGTHSLIVERNDVRAGDRVALVHGKSGRGVSAFVHTVNGAVVQLVQPILGLAAAIGHDASSDWKQVFLYCDAQSNEDFVYRHNRHVGGRAHGVKYNGTRAWIADNHFENINGNAVLAGYISEVSGHGARDVVVSGNSMRRCGWTPIEVRSTSGLGGNIIIRGNRIEEVRDAAIAVRGCERVRILGNTFASSTRPRQGAWIVTDQAKGVRASENAHATDVPLMDSDTSRP